MGITDKNIKVSVVMATYNGSQFVEEQILSIVNQTFPIYELIIQDDCSTDNTWEILQQLKEIFPVIQTYRNEKNLRAHETFRRAFLHASGDYIAPSDQDDIWKVNKIERLLNLIGENQLIVSQSEIWYADNVRKKSFEIYKPDVILGELIFYNNFPGHTMMFSNKLLDSFRITQNLEISFDHTAALYGVYCKSYVVTDEILQIWRRHDAVCTISEINSMEKSEIVNHISGYKKFFIVLKYLIKGQKSEKIKIAFFARKKYLEYLYGIHSDDKKLKLLINLADNMSKQTALSYIKAGFIWMKLNKIQLKNSLLIVVKKMLFNFRYPFTFWYDMQSVNAL